MKKIMNSAKLILLSIFIISLISCEDQVIKCPDTGVTPYKSLTKDELIEQVSNYRESIWKKTSPYYSASIINSNILKKPTGLVPVRDLHLANNKLIAENTRNFDARFADISRAELEDYLCTLRNLPNSDSINTVRIYYTRYGSNPGPDVDSSFAKKHSVALVPVIVDEEHETIREVLDNGQVDGYISYIMNHSWVCPPKKGWINSNTILHTADN